MINFRIYLSAKQSVLRKEFTLHFPLIFARRLTSCFLVRTVFSIYLNVQLRSSKYYDLSYIYPVYVYVTISLNNFCNLIFLTFVKTYMVVTGARTSRYTVSHACTYTHEITRTTLNPKTPCAIYENRILQRHYHEIVTASSRLVCTGSKPPTRR